MAILARALSLLLALLLALGVLAGGFLAWRAAGAFPQRDGKLHVPGLTAPVTVMRDANGLTQIYAANLDDLFLAEGYEHASERMWQMDVWRHISSGRMSELFGRSELELDEFVRTLGWRQSAERDLAAASPAAHAALDAYTAGVNAWLDGHPDGGLPFLLTGLLGAGGGLSGYHPEPWSPLDSVAWAKVEAWQLAGNLDSEIFQLAAQAKLGLSPDAPALLAALSPAYRSSMPVIVPTHAPGSGGAGATGVAVPGDASPAAGAGSGPPALASAPATGAVSDLLALDDLSSTIAAFTGLGDADAGLVGQQGTGSNDWVVSGARTASGHPILANDPHLGFAMPSIWYMVGLHCRPVTAACPLDVAGVSFAGMPGVVLGHNARIAWGFTNVDPDVQDLFQERVDPADPTRYQYKGRMRPFDTRQEVIRVAGGPPVTLTVRSTVHGPVVSGVEDALKSTADGGPGFAPGGYVYALAWTGTATVDHAIDTLLELDEATDWTSFRKAISLFGAPAQNIVYADVDGHIGYQTSGRVPIRAGGGRGAAPVPGWDGAHDWTGYVPFDQMPRLFDPPSGIIVTANNAVVDSRFPYFLGQEWDPGYRAARILDLLQATPKLTTGAMSRIQADARMGWAADVVPALAGADPVSADGRAVLQRIEAWAGGGTSAFQCTPDSSGCAAFNVFAFELLRAVFDPRLGAGTRATDLARLYVGSDRSAMALLDLLHHPESPWWDDPATSVRETEAQVISSALDRAGGDLRKTLGDPGAWQWGRIHQVSFAEMTLGSAGIPPLSALLDRGPFADGGANFAVDQQYYSIARAYPDPKGRPGADLRGTFAVQGGPSYRLVVDMGSLDGASIAITTGQSDVPFDRHFDDLIARYLAHEALPFPFTPSAVQARATQTLTLTP